MQIIFKQVYLTHGQDHNGYYHSGNIQIFRTGSTVSWDCRIHWLHFYRGVRPLLHQECAGYDIKQSDGEFPVMQKLWGMHNSPTLPSLPGPLWPRVVAPDSVLSMGQREKFDI